MARSGLPPRETTAPIARSCDAATSAAAAPVLAPKYPTEKSLISGLLLSQRGARGNRHRRRCRDPKPRHRQEGRIAASRCVHFAALATNRLRGLRRLLPLPWAKRTTPMAFFGIVNSPSNRMESQGIETGCLMNILPLSEPGLLPCLCISCAGFVCRASWQKGRQCVRFSWPSSCLPICRNNFAADVALRLS